MQLLVDLGIRIHQLEATVEQAVNDPVFARQDRLLDIVGLVGAEEVLAILGPSVVDAASYRKPEWPVGT